VPLERQLVSVARDAEEADPAVIRRLRTPKSSTGAASNNGGKRGKADTAQLALNGSRRSPDSHSI